MLLWLALLIVQPILIKKKKFAIHRYLGILSYFTTPILIVLMVLMYKNQFLRLESTGIPREENLALLFLPFTDILPFTLFYLLAIYYRKNIAKHMRFMIATAIVVLSAGLFRVILLLFKPDGFIGLQLTGVTLICFFLAFIVYDKVKGKPVRTNPFTIATILYIIPNLLFLIVPYTTEWQLLASSFVSLFD